MKKMKVIMMLVMLLLYGLSMFSVSYLYNKKEKEPSINVKKENISTKEKELYSSANYNTIRSLIYPVGSIYITTTDDTVEKVQARYGGTWVVYSAGRTLVGFDTSDGDFNMLGTGAGDKTHRHEAYNLKAMIGAYSSNPASIGYTMGVAGDPSTGGGGGNITYGIMAGSYVTNKPYNHFTPVVGFSSTNNSLPPYVVVYIYRRTA